MLSPEQLVITGPQLSTGDYFDETLLSQARKYGELFPATPPAATDPALDIYINLNYYDLGQAEYVTYQRTDDITFRDYGRKIADSWWQSPHIKAGTERVFDTFTYTPRNASLGGLILRALDGRPELWDWINAFTRAQFDAWLKIRINNTQLHYGVRDGAFMLRYAVWLARVLPDTFPLQAGGTTTNGAQLRAQYLSDIESILDNYFWRLQYLDGSWRWDDYDASGGPYIGIMQPFMVGLLLRTLCDAHQVVTNATTKAHVQEMIVDGCRHLYSGGPFSKQNVINFNVQLGGFHYFYHGGTKTEPTKYEKGDFPLDTTERWHVESARQAISTILGPFAYAYKISGDEFFKTAGEELYKYAYSGFDGFRAMMSDTAYTEGTAKNFNQHVLGNASYKAWLNGVTIPQPNPVPVPAPVKTPSPDGTKAATIIDSELAEWTIAPKPGLWTLRNGVVAGGGQGTEYKYLGQVVYVLGDVSAPVDSRSWYRWTGASWTWVGKEPGTVVPTPTPVPEPPTPEPPVLPAIRTAPWPKQIGKQNVLISLQWKDRYRLKQTDGITATFEIVS